MVQVELEVNGANVSHSVEDQTLLVEFLRQTLGLTGTHVGCDTSQCGACTVNLNGAAVKSCTVLAATASGGKVTTVEGLAKDGALGQFTGEVADSGEGRWTIDAAVEQAVPADVLAAALFVRFRSRQSHTFAEKMLSAMRLGFGGHVEKPKA